MFDLDLYRIDGEDKVCSPAMIYYSEVLEKNLERTIEIAGGAQRLWPHVKTHKMAKMIQMQMEKGIERFKCATVAEAEMTARCGAKCVLLAYPLVGPNVDRFLRLMDVFPDTEFFALGDDLESVKRVNDSAKKAGKCVNMLMDGNVGMNRTGVDAQHMKDMYKECAQLECVKLRGMHLYDGQIHEKNPQERQNHADREFAKADAVRRELQQDGYDVSILILGGTPTFPCHAGRKDVFLSPGTIFVSDWGYTADYPDLCVQAGAAILSRVVSRPTEDTFTIDLGHKGISADPKGQRGVIVGMEECTHVMQSEEHWVFKIAEGQTPPRVGDVVYVIPNHVCPATALYSYALIAKNHKITEKWTVTARNRRITI